MSLKEAFDKFEKTVGDLTSLEVTSYTGTITSAIKGETDKDAIKWEALIEDAKKETDAKISLVLASRFNFDGDATLFVAKGEIPADLRAAHNEAVKAGQQIRKDLMDLFSDTVKKLIKI